MVPLDGEYSETFKARLFGTVSFLLLIGILYAGLKPFRAPTNEVEWVPGANGVRFGEHGTLLSSDAFPASNRGRTMELWIEPHETVSGTMMLAFYNPAAGRYFALSQEERDLVLRLPDTHEWGFAAESRRNLGDVFSAGQSIFWTICAGKSGTDIYRDGRFVERSTGIRASAEELSGELVIGTAPIFDNSWRGTLLGLAVYDAVLSPAQVLRHYETWTRIGGGPAVEANDQCSGLYLFNEHSGRTVHNSCGASRSLDLPARYMIFSPTLLDPVWRAFDWSKGFWEDAVINLVGFMPLGFFLCAWLSASGRGSRPVLIATILGFSISLCIEIAQTHLPTRDSSMADVIDNLAGSVAGAWLYKTSLARAVERELEHLAGNLASKKRSRN